MNGFPFNSQIELYKNHIAKLRDMKPDAFIVATPGVIRLCQEIAPKIPIHLSTQANVLNYMDALVYRDLGVSRIIAAREASLKDLEGIKKAVPDMEIEAFVHGSMCFAYSGRCLISSLQTGRVANKGSCANDCRFPYEVYAKSEETGVEIKLSEDEHGTHIFNAKDLNLLNHLDEIVKSGVVDSVKIEGRTKAPYYLGITTRTYREALDEIKQGEFRPEKLYKELETTKNRGFTDGYLVKRPFDRRDTQNTETAISEGSMQVVAIVHEEREHVMIKHKTVVDRPYEIVVPKGITIETVENDVGRIYEDNGMFFVVFKQIITKKGNELTEIHSGNVNPVRLPALLPPYTFIRSLV